MTIFSIWGWCGLSAYLDCGSVIRCRPVGMLEVTDECGVDAKALAVPANKLCVLHRNVGEPENLPQSLLYQISHFFAHYKDLEVNEWVKVEGWLDSAEAKNEMVACVERFKAAP